MQHNEPVEAQVLELIKALQGKKYLKGFYLVGGTALALRLKHRKSLDIDLFINSDFDVSEILENIQHDFSFKVLYSANNTLKGSIHEINTDIIAHRYPYIEPPLTESGIEMLSLPDIAAMKLNAISTSGQRSKDFIDLYYLSALYTVQELIAFYTTKYSQGNNVVVLKSLVYFDDVDLADWPVLVKDPELTWNDVKKHLTAIVREYIKTQGKGFE